MGGQQTPAPAGWLVVATLPKGERYVVLPPDGQPVDHERATSLAAAVDWHCEVHAVGQAVRVWRAIGWDPEEVDEEQYSLPSPWESPPSARSDAAVLDELAALFRADTTTGADGYAEARRIVASTGRNTEPLEDDPEQAVFYLVDGQPRAGTVQDYGRAHHAAQLDLVDVPEVVWTWSVVLTPDAPGGATWGWTDHTVGVTTVHEAGERVVTLRVLDQLVRYRVGAAG